MFNTTTQTKTATRLDTEPHTEVRIDALGRVLVEGKNYEGDACSVLGDRIRRAFGGGGSKTDKPEAFSSARENLHNGPNW